MDYLEKIRLALNETYPGAGRNVEGSSAPQGSSETNPEAQTGLTGPGTDTATAAGNANLEGKAGKGDATPPKQGDSEKPDATELNNDNIGPSAAAAIKHAVLPQNHGPGSVATATNLADPSTVINQPKSKGNVWQESTSQATITADEYEALSDEEKAAYTPMTEDVAPAEPQVLELSLLFEGEEFSDEFKTKASAILEAWKTAKETELREAIEAQSVTAVLETLEEQLTVIADVLGEYMDQQVQVWAEQNKLAIQTGLRHEIVEGFVVGLKTLFETHYIQVPEEQYDLIGDLQTQVTTLETQLAEQVTVAEGVIKERNALIAEQIVTKVTAGLATSQTDKFRTLLENITFEDPATYEQKLEAVKGTFFKVTQKTADETPAEVIGESTVDPAMTALAARLASLNSRA